MGSYNMVFSRKSNKNYEESGIRCLYKAKYRRNIYIIKEKLTGKNVFYDLYVYKDDNMIYTIKNITSFREAEQKAYKFGKSLLPDNNIRYRSNTSKETKRKREVFGSKVTSLEIKLNTLLKKYPDEKGLKELKNYFEEIL
jgi:hypothetical protein